MNKNNTKLSRRFGTFTVVPNAFFKTQGITLAEFRMFAYLCYRTNSETDVAFPSYETIKKDTGMSFQTIATAARGLELKGWLSRRKRFSGSTIYSILIPLKIRAMDDSTVLQNLECSPLKISGQSSKNQSLTRRVELDEVLDEVPVLSELGDRGNTEISPPANDTNSDITNDTLPLRDSGSAQNPPIPRTPPAPARARANPADVAKADDLIMAHAARATAATLTNWDIKRDNLEAARAGTKGGESKKIAGHLNQINNTVAEIANAVGFRCWWDKGAALDILAMDTPLDWVKQVVTADAEKLATEQGNRTAYGLRDAVQALRIAQAAVNQKMKSDRPGEYYTNATGELVWRWL